MTQVRLSALVGRSLTSLFIRNVLHVYYKPTSHWSQCEVGFLINQSVPIVDYVVIVPVLSTNVFGAIVCNVVSMQYVAIGTNLPATKSRPRNTI